MGRSYLFECPKCTYKATVSGGWDQGLDCSVQTAVCRDCKKVFDAVIRLRVLVEPARSVSKLRGTRAFTGAAPEFEKILNRLPLPASGNFEWLQFKLRCPKYGHHKVQMWIDPGKCPVCGSFLEKAGLPFRIWE